MKVEHDTIGTTLKSIRKDRGFTLEDIHVKVDISVPYLSEVENDKVNISYQKLEALVNFYGYEIALIHKSNPMCRGRSE